MKEFFLDFLYSYGEFAWVLLKGIIAICIVKAAWFIYALKKGIILISS